MIFHCHGYLPRQSFREKLARVVKAFGQETQQYSSSNILSATEFLSRLDTALDLDTYGDSTRSVAVVIISTEQWNGGYLGFTLGINPIYLLKPELSEKGDQTEREEVWSQPPFIVSSGFNTAPDGNADIARSGYVSVFLEGYFVSDAHVPEYDASELRLRHRNALISVLDVMTPDYAFLTIESDYALWMYGPLKRFPPLEPWQFLWTFMSFGKPVIEKFGRERLLSTPAHEIMDHGNMIHIQPFDFIFTPREDYIDKFRGQPFRRDMPQKTEAVLKHLDLQLPYEGIF